MTGLKTLRVISIAEGVSLLLLVFVAMPLKYALDLPLAVRVVGILHGVLFLGLLSTSLQVKFAGAVSASRLARVFGWALVPFGFIAADRLLRSRTLAQHTRLKS